MPAWIKILFIGALFAVTLVIYAVMSDKDMSETTSQPFTSKSIPSKVTATTTEPPPETTTITETVEAEVNEAPDPAPEPTVQEGYVYYPECKYAPGPITIGEPGYRPPLDRDSDGIACELSGEETVEPQPIPEPIYTAPTTTIPPTTTTTPTPTTTIVTLPPTTTTEVFVPIEPVTENDE